MRKIVMEEKVGLQITGPLLQDLRLALKLSCDDRRRRIKEYKSAVACDEEELQQYEDQLDKWSRMIIAIDKSKLDDFGNVAIVVGP